MLKLTIAALLTVTAVPAFAFDGSSMTFGNEFTVFNGN
jgi:hypothetical protein